MEGKIMVNINKNIKKVCSFYVSNCHLATMLLPHINEKINEKVKITTILEESLQVEMKMLLEKLELNNKEKITKARAASGKNATTINGKRLYRGVRSGRRLSWSLLVGGLHGTTGVWDSVTKMGEGGAVVCGW